MTSVSGRTLPRELAITGQGIGLRTPHPDDAEALFANLTSSSTVTRYLSWSPHRSPAETASFLEAVAATNESSATGDVTWVIAMTDGTPVGLFSCWFDRSFSAEVGFCLGENWWHRGIMTAALTAVVDVARDIPSIYRIWATCDSENARSAALLTRTGFVHEGTLTRHAIRPNVQATPRISELYGLALR